MLLYGGEGSEEEEEAEGKRAGSRNKVKEVLGMGNRITHTLEVHSGGCVGEENWGAPGTRITPVGLRLGVEAPGR